MNQQNAAAFDVRKKYLNNAVGKGDHSKNVEQVNTDVICYGEAALQYGCAFTGKINASAARKDSRQVVGKDVLQADAEFIQFHRHDADEGAGEEAFQDIDCRGFDGCPAVLVLNGGIKYGDHRACHKECPPKESKQLNGGLHPIESEDIRAHVSHRRKEIRNSAVYGFIKPLEHGVPDGIGNLFAKKLKGASDGVANSRKNIA